MYYISNRNPRTGEWAITDTEDGVEEWFTEDVVRFMAKKVKIEGVGRSIAIVEAARKVAQQSFDGFETKLRGMISGWTEEQCMAIAKKGSFVRKIKGLPKSEMNKVMLEQLYPSNIQEAVVQASQYTNRLIEINSAADLERELKSGICLVLQHKTNMVVTSFMCTGSLAVVDTVTRPGFFDAVYLTKNLYGYTYGYDKLRPLTDREKAERDPALKSVFSCALRFRAEGKHHDGAMRELSSPFYTVNLNRILGAYKLADPHGIGDAMLGEFTRTWNKEIYKFDMDMFNLVQQSIQQGVNLFKNRELFMSFIPVGVTNPKVTVEDAMARFDSDFGYMQYLRSQGYSFK